MATRGDAEMEAAALAQLATQPLLGLDYSNVNMRLVAAPALKVQLLRVCSTAIPPTAR